MSRARDSNCCCTTPTISKIRARLSLEPSTYRVLVVAVIYVIVTVGAQMLVPDPLIVANGEVWPSVAGRRALGTAGGWVAIATLLFATSSAINATLFSPARLVRDLSIVQELPARLGHARGGLPATATSVLTLIE